MVDDTKEPKVVGIAVHLPASDDRPDLFELAVDAFAFPCLSCKHVARPTDECRPCCHYG